MTGELLINSIDGDGTGHGLDFRILEALPLILEQQVVLMGGVGKPSHIVEALEHSQVDAVATANLLNFIGNGLGEARRACRDSGIALPGASHQRTTGSCARRIEPQMKSGESSAAGDVDYATRK